MGASGYDGPDIGEKTLVSWAIMDNLDVQKGSILTIDRLSDPTDAIVFGERQHHRWMAGSGWFHRTQDPKPGFEEKKTGLIMMAISYTDDGGTARVQIYRNGDKIDYTFGQFVTFDKGCRGNLGETSRFRWRSWRLTLISIHESTPPSSVTRRSKNCYPTHLMWKRTVNSRRHGHG